MRKGACTIGLGVASLLIGGCGSGPVRPADRPSARESPPTDARVARRVDPEPAQPKAEFLISLQDYVARPAADGIDEGRVPKSPRYAVLPPPESRSLGPLERAVRWDGVSQGIDLATFGYAGLGESLRQWGLRRGPTSWLEAWQAALPDYVDRRALKEWVLLAIDGSHGPAANALVKLLTADSPSLRLLAARLAGAAPDSFDARRALGVILARGARPGRDVIAALNLPPAVVRAIAGPWADDRDAALRTAALDALAAVGGADPDDPALAAALLARTRSASRDERRLAASAAGTPQARRAARVGDLLEDLRSPVAWQRSRAAHDLLALGPARGAVLAALVRATDAGDYVVREGLTIALERDWRTGAGVSAVLAAADAERDAAARAYLRAARRAVGE